jgi:hypothetical protein
MQLLKKWFGSKLLPNKLQAAPEGDIEVLRLTSHGPEGFVIFSVGSNDISILFYLEIRLNAYKQVTEANQLLQYIAAHFERWEKLGVFNGRLDRSSGTPWRL